MCACVHACVQGCEGMCVCMRVCERGGWGGGGERGATNAIDPKAHLFNSPVVWQIYI